MAFIPSATTVTLTAKLTPFGRQQLLANSNKIITQFSLGDSDANYRTTDPLESGQVPNFAGNIGTDNSTNNSITDGVKIRSRIVANNAGGFTKAIQPNSIQVNSTIKNNGFATLTGTSLTRLVIDRTSGATDSNVNLFNTFGLPITESSKNLFTTIKDASGGFADTALSSLNQDKILVISIDAVSYGEMLDGRTVKLDITTSAGTYSFYSTYQRTLTPLAVQDTKTSEISQKAITIGDNIAFLFSDEIRKPNNNILKSWATGFNTIKPFSVNKKELFNLTTNTSVNAFADRACGIAYLDKGLIVITEPTIVDSFNTGSTTVLSFDNVSTEVSQDVTCIVDRGEFAASKNPTYNTGDLIRVSEVGLHDAVGNLLALAKTSEHILIGANQFLALGIKITV